MIFKHIFCLLFFIYFGGLTETIFNLLFPEEGCYDRKFGNKKWSAIFSCRKLFSISVYLIHVHNIILQLLITIQIWQLNPNFTHLGFPFYNLLLQCFIVLIEWPLTKSTVHLKSGWEPPHPGIYTMWSPGCVHVFSPFSWQVNKFLLNKINKNCCKLEAPYIYKNQLTPSTTFITTSDRKT